MFLNCYDNYINRIIGTVLTLDNKNKKTLCFYFVLCSLFRTFGFAEGTYARQ